MGKNYERSAKRIELYACTFRRATNIYSLEDPLIEITEIQSFTIETSLRRREPVGRITIKSPVYKFGR